jgi:hypothetical protein
MVDAWLIIDAVIAGLGAVVWVAVSAIALTAFGAPGTSVDFHAWAFVLTLWSYPIWGIAPVIVAWMLRRRRPRRSLALSLLPFALIVAAGIAFWR